MQRSSPSQRYPCPRCLMVPLLRAPTVLCTDSHTPAQGCAGSRLPSRLYYTGQRGPAPHGIPGEAATDARPLLEQTLVRDIWMPQSGSPCPIGGLRLRRTERRAEGAAACVAAPQALVRLGVAHGGAGWARAVGGKGRLIFLYSRSGIHRAHKLDTTLEHYHSKLRFHFLPAHCGHHRNPIEGFLRVMKDTIGAGRCFGNLQQLYQRTRRVLMAHQERPIYAFHW